MDRGVGIPMSSGWFAPVVRTRCKAGADTLLFGLVGAPECVPAQMAPVRPQSALSERSLRLLMRTDLVVDTEARIDRQ